MKILSQSEFEITVQLLNGKTFTVYSSVGKPLDLLLTLWYPENVKRISPETKLTQVFERSLETTNVTFQKVG